MNYLPSKRYSRLGLSIILGLLLTLIAFSTIHAQEPGDLDTTFNTTNNSGIVTTPIGSESLGHAVAKQPDGKIVVAGFIGFDGDYAVARYNIDGSLDPEFNNGTGVVTNNIGVGGHAVAIQRDGKIVTAGYSGLIRYTITGTPDTNFNGNGIVTYGGGRDVAIQPSDRKIVVAGSYEENFRVIRYQENGNPDATFGSSGIATAPVGTGTEYRAVAKSLAIQSDGKIVVAGEVYSSLSMYESDVTIVRFTITGSVDSSFNSTGIVTIPLGPGENVGYGVAIQTDEKIVVTGFDNSGDTPHVLLARINDDGILDTTFGSNGNGVVTTSIGSNAIVGFDIDIQRNGKIVVAGANVKSNDDADIAVLRYNSDGTLDTGFGQSGVVTTPLGGIHEIGHSVAIQSDGKIVVAGWDSDADDSLNNFAVVRYLGDEIQFSYLPLILKN